jgi:hypothetical protein
MPIEEWIDRIVDTLDTIQKANLGFKELFCSAATPELADADTAMHHRYVAGLESVLVLRLPDFEPERRHICAEVCVRASEALLHLLGEAEGERRSLVLAELKRLLTAYMDRLLDEQRGVAGRSA